jgi:hypothetical protein
MYKQVVLQHLGTWYSFFIPFDIEDSVDYFFSERGLDTGMATGKTIREALSEARKIRPTDGDVMYTYMERLSDVNT